MPQPRDSQAPGQDSLRGTQEQILDRISTARSGSAPQKHPGQPDADADANADGTENSLAQPKDVADAEANSADAGAEANGAHRAPSRNPAPVADTPGIADTVRQIRPRFRA